MAAGAQPSGDAHVTAYNFWWSKTPSLTKRGSASDARLHTATSSGEVYSTISVQRFEQRIVPKFCWLDLRLAESLYRMYGVPVSICESSTENQSCWAGTLERALPSASYCSYSRSNSSPQDSASPGHSLGQKNDHSALACAIPAEERPISA